MLKKILIGLGVLMVVLIALFMYMNHRNRTLSPPGTAEVKINDLTIEVKYSRPSVKGRLIFGSEAEEALQPYGKYWRLGANEATEIKINKDITLNDLPLKAGSYTMYAIPGANTFRIGVNSEVGKWGAWEPDYSKDLFVTEIPVNKLETPVEVFTSRIEKASDSTAVLYFEWSDVQLNIPIGF